MKLWILDTAILLSFSALQMQCLAVFADEITSTTDRPAANSTEPSKEIWDEWHKSLAEELFTRIKLEVSKLGRSKEESHFHVKVIWCVCKDGNVSLKEIKDTESLLVQEAVRIAVDSMKFIPLVKFPSGSTREYVEKISEFGVGLQTQWTRFGDFDATMYKPQWKKKGNK
jgi:hypothetical protein